MRTNIVWAAASLALAGCSSTSPVTGVLWMQIAAPTGTWEDTCEESFSRARCPNRGGGGDSEWVVTTTAEMSPRTTFAELLRGRADHRDRWFLVLDGRTYPGTREGDVYTFTWEGADDATTDAEHESGYVSGASVQTTIETTIELTRDGGDNGFTGELVEESVTKTTRFESDEWRARDVGRADGEIESDAFATLVAADRDEGSWWTNASDEDDCGGQRCTITRTVRTSSSLGLVASWALGADPSAIDPEGQQGQPHGADPLYPVEPPEVIPGDTGDFDDTGSPPDETDVPDDTWDTFL